jgi:A/G-specific adenine glycosylase
VRWYRRARRDLPWRRRRDAYAVWVSEIMLQQTRAEVVAPYYERFMARYPDVATLAAASPADVLQAWAGLGYYARARNLHAAARTVVAEHGGRLPRGELDALPGIGRYTAGAIRSIAWDEPAPILDGNVARVFARLFGVDGASALVRARHWDLAARWARGSHPGDANQALMELGATVCTKPRPACARCPVESVCVARAAGRELELPAPRRRAPAKRLALAALVVAHRGRILLVRRRDGQLLRDWWELPTLAAVGAEAIADAAAARLRMPLAAMRRIARVRHAILQHAIEATVWYTEPGGSATREPSGARRATPARARALRSAIANLEAVDLDRRWVSGPQCRALPLSTLTRKALGAAAVREPRWARYTTMQD